MIKLNYINIFFFSLIGVILIYIILLSFYKQKNIERFINQSFTENQNLQLTKYPNTAIINNHYYDNGNSNDKNLITSNNNNNSNYDTGKCDMLNKNLSTTTMAEYANNRSLHEAKQRCDNSCDNSSNKYQFLPMQDKTILIGTLLTDQQKTDFGSILSNNDLKNIKTDSKFVEMFSF